jgi:glyoxylase-like metal-dependent hydrolase (beta-lactamase superfamily II)
MVDTPKYGTSAKRAVESLTGPNGPDYLFLTHVDDTADHQKWADHYNKLQRIFHSGDLGRHNWIGDITLEEVEILLPDKPDQENTLTAFSLDGQELDDNWKETYSEELVILCTPGHSNGSISLYRRPSSSDNQPGIIFTGDSYGWTTRYGGRMSGMGRYGNDLRRQAKTLKKLLDLDWQVIAPGHSHPRDYRDITSQEQRKELQKEELFTAVEDLLYLRV